MRYEGPDFPPLAVDTRTDVFTLDEFLQDDWVIVDLFDLGSGVTALQFKDPVTAILAERLGYRGEPQSTVLETLHQFGAIGKMHALGASDFLGNAQLRELPFVVQEVKLLQCRQGKTGNLDDIPVCDERTRGSGARGNHHVDAKVADAVIDLIRVRLIALARVGACARNERFAISRMAKSG